jgi:hypothetical protein
MSILKKLQFEKIGAGPIQVVDEMTIVPLVGEEHGDLAEPFSLKFERTSDYGHMVYSNTDEEKAVIVPSNMMVRGPRAQDHAMAGSGIVLAKKSITFQNACCIESSQGGYLSQENNEYDILPIQLRKVFLSYNKRTENNYEKLWPHITKWLNGIGVGKSAHLRYFYDNDEIKESLETFSAEFEPVVGQIGAVVLFQEKIVGIEVMPSVEHWGAYWKFLIRGCYGAELIRLKKLGQIKPSSLHLPSFPDVVSDPNALTQIVDNFTEKLTQDIVTQLDTVDLKSAKSIGRKSEFETVLLSTETAGSIGGGDLITQNDKPIYLSIVI